MLFAIGGLNSVYGIDNTALNVLSIVLPGVITIGGILWAYISFKQVINSQANRFTVLVNIILYSGFGQLNKWLANAAKQ